MPKYFDASAFFPLFVADPHSASMEEYISSSGSDYALSNLTIIETISAVSRAVRSRRLSNEDGERAIDNVYGWAGRRTLQHDILSEDFTRAEDFIRRFDLGLRPADALHVAICRRLGLTLLTCDLAQGRAARELGIETIQLSGEPS